MAMWEAERNNNALTPSEWAAGWRLLFDGRTTQGWRRVGRREPPGSGWVVEDGALKLISRRERQGRQGGDIITVEPYADFDLVLEWKIEPGGNSGIKYPVSENRSTGFEYQILDDDRHPDARHGGNRTAGALYDLIAPTNKALRPVGQYNQTRLLVYRSRVQHWLNGQRVVAFQRGSAEMKALIARSKYKDIPGFGEAARGHILLQDHGDTIWFRNIKIRVL